MRWMRSFGALVTLGAAALVATATATPVSAAASSTLLAPAVLITLRKLGFTRIVELRGGMKAWRQTGRTLVPSKPG